MDKKNLLKKAAGLVPLIAFTFAISPATHAKRNHPDFDTTELGLKKDTIQSSKLNFSGYVQIEGQYGERNAILDVGAPNLQDNQGYNRIGIRRGRLKLKYEETFIESVFQVDLTEKGVTLKDAYMGLKNPKYPLSALKIGLQNIPFGAELSESSAIRPSPERSMVSRMIFPDEWDLGLMATLNPSVQSPWHFLTLQLGIVSGNGIHLDIKNAKDFVGQVSIRKEWESKTQITSGFSYYRGRYAQNTDSLYLMDGYAFQLKTNPSDFEKYLRRTYFGLNFRLVIPTFWGLTKLDGEFDWGRQPGDRTGSRTFQSNSVQNSPVYSREFCGGYISWWQQIFNSAFSFILKFDRYQPNIQIHGDEIGLFNTSEGDIAYNNLGVGLIYEKQKIKLTLYTDLLSNERSLHLAGFEVNRPDNKFIARFQYKF